MAHVVATTQQAPGSVPTLLGSSAQRIPTGGKIRAGIKVLTKKAAEHAKARELYDEGVAAGHGFERIEDDITAAIPELKTPLVPKNAPYFTVRAGDFPNPEIARQILEAFGEDRGDGERRLYRFPVVFPSDAWQSVMPHEMACWGASERKFWSEYSPDGQTRYCKCYAPVPVKDGKRALRIFGGRKIMMREENGGVCEPEACKQYQERKCNLSGRFIFFIPGIKSISAFELGTHSFYAMNAAIQKFQTVGFMRGGRISGFLDGKRTPFYLSKKLTEVAHIDEEGRAVRVKQWLIELEAPIDLTALLRPDEGHEALEHRAAAAVNVLEGQGRTQVVSRFDDVDVFDAPAASQKPQQLRQGEGRQDIDDAPMRRGAEHANETRTAERTQQPAAGRTPASKVANAGNAGDTAAELAAIVADAQQLGIEATRFDQYADKRWGKGWKVNATGRKRAHEEVRSFAQDAQGFRTKVDAELNVFS